MPVSSRHVSPQGWSPSVRRGRKGQGGLKGREERSPGQAVSPLQGVPVVVHLEVTGVPVLALGSRPSVCSSRPDPHDVSDPSRQRPEVGGGKTGRRRVTTRMYTQPLGVRGEQCQRRRQASRSNPTGSRVSCRRHRNVYQTWRSHGDSSPTGGHTSSTCSISTHGPTVSLSPYRRFPPRPTSPYQTPQCLHLETRTVGVEVRTDP